MLLFGCGQNAVDGEKGGGLAVLAHNNLPLAHSRLAWRLALYISGGPCMFTTLQYDAFSAPFK